MSPLSFVSTPTGSVFESASRATSRTQSASEQRFESSTTASLSRCTSVASMASTVTQRTVEAGGLAWLLAYGLEPASLAQMAPPTLLVDGQEVFGDRLVCQAWREAQRCFRLTGGAGAGAFGPPDQV